MATYSLPHFGPVDFTNLEEYYDITIDFNGQEIELDLNFENKTIEVKRLDTVRTFLEKIPGFDRNNKKYIEEDYGDDDCDTVKLYVQHHLEEIDKAELTDLIDFDNKAISLEEQLMKALRLVRIGLYPDSEDQFAIFDYSIGRDLTNYLVVLFTDEKGKLDYMTMES
ncbi:DUF2004 domain-containing protein [Foetidibacter luteolus]|uniref:DUF2004 domain-containing protein n=1 Tax=Foetidibacter luteolus TaxID=2608880 RepID=UPI00129A1BC4|nr:DUF2004 domain-containing protein [Foetidibacter luteolus]